MDDAYQGHAFDRMRERHGIEGNTFLLKALADQWRAGNACVVRSTPSVVIAEAIIGIVPDTKRIAFVVSKETGTIITVLPTIDHTHTSEKTRRSWHREKERRRGKAFRR